MGTVVNSRNRLGPVIGILLVLGCLFGGPAQAGITEETVTVGSGGKVEVKSDLLKVALGVQSKGNTAEAAENELARKGERVVRRLKAAGFRKIETTDVSISRRREKGEFVGYVGSLSLKVRTGKTSAAPRIVDVASAAGASVRDVVFDVKDKSEAIQMALAQAMEFAKAKARTLAESADRELGRAIKIREGSTEAPRALHLDAGDESAGGTAGGGGSALPIKAPKLSASARIQVTFELI
jgi:uncharacterized protein